MWGRASNFAFEMDEDAYLKEFCTNYRRYCTNIDAIIKKYDQAFEDDDEVNITSLSIHTDKGKIRSCKFGPRNFGSSHLKVTKVRDIDVTCLGDSKDSALGPSLVTQHMTDSDNTHTSYQEKQAYSDSSFVGNLSIKDALSATLKDIAEDILCRSDPESEPSDAETLSSASDSEDDASPSLENDLDTGDTSGIDDDYPETPESEESEHSDSDALVTEHSKVSVLSSDGEYCGTPGAGAACVPGWRSRVEKWLDTVSNMDFQGMPLWYQKFSGSTVEPKVELQPTERMEIHNLIKCSPVNCTFSDSDPEDLFNGSLISEDHVGDTTASSQLYRDRPRVHTQPHLHVSDSESEDSVTLLDMEDDTDTVAPVRETSEGHFPLLNRDVPRISNETFLVEDCRRSVPHDRQPTVLNGMAPLKQPTAPLKSFIRQKNNSGTVHHTPNQPKTADRKEPRRLQTVLVKPFLETGPLSHSLVLKSVTPKAGCPDDYKSEPLVLRPDKPVTPVTDINLNELDSCDHSRSADDMRGTEAVSGMDDSRSDTNMNSNREKITEKVCTPKRLPYTPSVPRYSNEEFCHLLSSPGPISDKLVADDLLVTVGSSFSKLLQTAQAVPSCAALPKTSASPKMIGEVLSMMKKGSPRHCGMKSVPARLRATDDQRKRDPWLVPPVHSPWSAIGSSPGQGQVSHVPRKHDRGLSVGKMESPGCRNSGTTVTDKDFKSPRSSNAPGHRNGASDLGFQSPRSSIAPGYCNGTSDLGFKSPRSSIAPEHWNGASDLGFQSPRSSIAPGHRNGAGDIGFQPSRSSNAPGYGHNVASDLGFQSPTPRSSSTKYNCERPSPSASTNPINRGCIRKNTNSPSHLFSLMKLQSPVQGAATQSCAPRLFSSKCLFNTNVSPKLSSRHRLEDKKPAVDTHTSNKARCTSTPRKKGASTPLLDITCLSSIEDCRPKAASSDTDSTVRQFSSSPSIHGRGRNVFSNVPAKDSASSLGRLSSSSESLTSEEDAFVSLSVTPKARRTVVQGQHIPPPDNHVTKKELARSGSSPRCLLFNSPPGKPRPRPREAVKHGQRGSYGRQIVNNVEPRHNALPEPVHNKSNHVKIGVPRGTWTHSRPQSLPRHHMRDYSPKRRRSPDSGTEEVSMLTGDGHTPKKQCGNSSLTCLGPGRCTKVFCFSCSINPQ